VPDDEGNNLLEANKEVADYVKEEHSCMKFLRPTQYDVGVDGNNFYPVSYNNLKKIITSKK
jgi:calcineurin-like phosphoesterase family protein